MAVILYNEHALSCITISLILYNQQSLAVKLYE